MRLYYFAVLMPLCSILFAQNLMKERIWKIDSRKKSVFLKRGIFHSGARSIQSQLVGVRSSQTAGNERIVFDFNTEQAPRLYGHLSDSQNKLYIDFFGSTMDPGLSFPKNGHYVKNLNFFPLGQLDQKGPGVLSVEIKFKSSVSAEIFHLSSPGRLVIDLKK